MRQRRQEPDVLRVTLEDWRGHRVDMDNDGTITTRYCTDDGDDRLILQTRAAFRGFVGSLTDLLNYTIVDGSGEWNEEGGEV